MGVCNFVGEGGRRKTKTIGLSVSLSHALRKLHCHFVMGPKIARAVTSLERGLYMAITRSIGAEPLACGCQGGP